jgi:hypothetical protein
MTNAGHDFHLCFTLDVFPKVMSVGTAIVTQKSFAFKEMKKQSKEIGKAYGVA